MKNSKIAIINGTLFIHNTFIKGYILIKGNKINKVSNDDFNRNNYQDYRIIDASDAIVSYGFFDPHVHFRTPGLEYKEDWQSGSLAALKGGFTYVLDMPNTNPPTTSLKDLEEKNRLASKSHVHYGFYIGLTADNSANIGKIFKKALQKKIPLFGIKVYQGSTTGDLLVKEETAISDALATGYFTLFHAEDEDVLKEYQHLEGKTIRDHTNRRPPQAAVAAIEKIIEAAKLYKDKAKIYLCHISSRAEVNLLNKYRNEGYSIIGEISPHHLFFELSKIDDSPFYKVNPPLRDKEDVEFLRTKFNQGFFDIIGSDHAPHLRAEKEGISPPSGMPGLESAFYALYHLYEQKKILLAMVFSRLTSAYQIFKIRKRGKLKKGYFADITIIKKGETEFNSAKTATKSDFSPFDGLWVPLRIDTVIVDGVIKLHEGEIIINVK